MNDDRLYSVIVEPHVTEKATNIGDQGNQYTFKVLKDATKHEIKHAVEKLFDVSVLKVSTVNVKGKVKPRMLRRGSVSRFKSWKKAYVRLAEGDDIDFTREF